MTFKVTDSVSVTYGHVISYLEDQQCETFIVSQILQAKKLSELDSLATDPVIECAQNTSWTVIAAYKLGRVCIHSMILLSITFIVGVELKAWVLWELLGDLCSLPAILPNTACGKVR